MVNGVFNSKEDFFLSTGFKSLDDILGGFRNSCLYTLGGAPGIGKTTFVLSLLQKIAENDVPVGIFSYEMTKTQIVGRLLSMKNDVSSERFISQKMMEHELQAIHNSLPEFNKLKIFIEASKNLKIDELVVKAKEFKDKEDIQLLIVDDVQRIPIDNFSREYASNREQEISANVRELKRLARELSIPILMISQLNRMLESRGGNKRPILTDLRDSGAIENDSDVVLFLYRAEYYDFFVDAEGDSTNGIAEIMMSKNRHGSLDSVRLSYDSQIPVFRDFVESKIVSSKNQMFSFDNDEKPPF